MAGETAQPCLFALVFRLRTSSDPTPAPPCWSNPRDFRRRPGQRPHHRALRRCGSDFLPMVHDLLAALHARPGRHRDPGRPACQRLDGVAIRQHSPRGLFRRPVRSKARTGHRRYHLLGHSDVPLRHCSRPLVLPCRPSNQRLRVYRRPQLRMFVCGRCPGKASSDGFQHVPVPHICGGSVSAHRGDDGRHMEHRAGRPGHHARQYALGDRTGDGASAHPPRNDDRRRAHVGSTGDATGGPDIRISP
jgi:hypothetical protein